MARSARSRRSSLSSPFSSLSAHSRAWKRAAPSISSGFSGRHSRIRSISLLRRCKSSLTLKTQSTGRSPLMDCGTTSPQYRNGCVTPFCFLKTRTKRSAATSPLIIAMRSFDFWLCRYWLCQRKRCPSKWSSYPPSPFSKVTSRTVTLANLTNPLDQCASRGPVGDVTPPTLAISRRLYCSPTMRPSVLNNSCCAMPGPIPKMRDFSVVFDTNSTSPFRPRCASGVGAGNCTRRSRLRFVI